jgi:hypothetical protein
MQDEGAKSGGPHGGNALNEGFLGTAAPRYTDVNLVVIILLMIPPIVLDFPSVRPSFQ